MTVPKYDPIADMPVDMQEKMRELIKNPSLLSRRFEITQLVARYLVLYERLQKKEALGKSSLEYIREGLQEIANGQINPGMAKIAEALELRETEREIYSDIYQTMSLLTSMTSTEIKSIKELRQMITIEQFVAAMAGVADDLAEALLHYEPDERIRQLVAGSVEQRIARRFNAGSGSVLAAAEQADDDSVASSAQQVAE